MGNLGKGQAEQGGVEAGTVWSEASCNPIHFQIRVLVKIMIMIRIMITTLVTT